VYTIKVYSAVKQDAKKLDRELQREIKERHFPNIEQNPFQANPLSYQFKGLWPYHVNYQGSQYRIVYAVYPEDKCVLVIMIGPREGFYETLRRRIK